MRTVIGLVIILCSFQLNAACKCNCNPMDAGICASLYDLDHPCEGVCESVPGFAPMRTACSVSLVMNPMTGIKEWRTNCVE